MKVFFIYPETLFHKFAREVSILNTFDELKKNCDCKLITTELNSSLSDLNRYFSTDILDKDLIILNKKFFFLKSTKIFNYKLKKIINDKKNSDCIFFTRHLKIAEFLINNKKENQKVVFDTHESFYFTNFKNRDKLYKQEEFIFKNCNGLTFHNKSTKERISEIYQDIAKNCIINNGVKKVFEFKNKQFKTNEIAYFGSFLPWKGLDLLLSLLENNEKLKLFLYGNDASKDAIKLKNSLKDDIKNRVFFMGYIHYSDVLNELYNNERILIIPSVKSVYSDFSTPLKLFEYLATSNLVIAPNFNPLKEILIDNKDSFLYEATSIESLEKTINNLSRISNDKLNEISKNACEKMKSFSYDIRAKKILEFMKSL